MNIKTFKTKNRAGFTEYVETVDMDGIIAITAAIWREQPDNPKCLAFFAWIRKLGHKPTDDEYLAWLRSMGANPIAVEAEDYEN